MSPGATLASPAASRTREFVRQLRSQRLRGRLGQTALAIGLPCACALLALALWSPRVTWWGALVALPALGVTLLWVARRERRETEARALARLTDAPRGLDDELLTWTELDRRGAGQHGMAAWLLADVAREIAALPVDRRPRLWRPRLGRWRYLVPLLVVLLLLRWLAPVLPVPTPGLLGGGTGGAGSGPGTGGGAPSPAGTAPAPQAGTQLPEPPPPPPPPEPDPEPEPEPEPPLGPPSPPPPLLDLPASPTAVVPEFIGDGPSRKALAEVALVAAGGNAAAGAGSEGNAPRVPEPTRHEFERAAERALRSRHVPAVEQPMVKRFFELLQQEGR